MIAPILICLFVVAIVWVVISFIKDNSVRELSETIFASLETDDGWEFSKGEQQIGGEISYDPNWANRKLDLTIWTVDHTIVRGLNFDDEADVLIEMNDAEVEAFEAAIEKRELRLVKQRRAG